MKILEIDAGNTRVKWRLLALAEHNGVSEKSVICSDAVMAIGLTNELPKLFYQQLNELQNENIALIRVSNVRGGNFADALSRFCAELFSVDVFYATPENGVGGVDVAYDRPETLGVDRWLAMLAAFRQCKSAVCVVDCGSAITVDLVDESGAHLGGFIVPGLRLMQHSLDEQTADLYYQPETNASTEPGVNTVEAINHGVLNMALGMLEKVHRQWGSACNWYFCGGDAKVLSGFIAWQHELQADLVLDGLETAWDAIESGREPG